MGQPLINRPLGNGLGIGLTTTTSATIPNMYASPIILKHLKHFKTIYGFDEDEIGGEVAGLTRSNQCRTHGQA